MPRPGASLRAPVRRQHHRQTIRLARLLAQMQAYAACGGFREVRLHQADEIAQSGGLLPLTLDAGGFRVLGFERPGPRQNVLVVYIEGDGRADEKYGQADSDQDDDDPAHPGTGVRAVAGFLGWFAILARGRMP